MTTRNTSAGVLCACALAFPVVAAPQQMMDDFGHAPRRPLVQADSQQSDGPLRTDVLSADWLALGPYGGDIGDVAYSTASPTIVLAGLAPASGGGGLYRSTDSGATWTEVAALEDTPVWDIEFLPNGDVLIGTQDGPMKSTDDGLSWTVIDLGIGLNQQTYEITIDPQLPSTIWVGVSDALGSQDKNVLRSLDGGATWQDRTPVMSPLGCEGIAIDPSNSSRVFACFAGAFGGGSVYFTADGGATWFNRSSGLPNNPMNDILFDGSRAILTGGQLFGSQHVGIFESTDEGLTWDAFHDGSWPSMVFNDLTTDPNDPSIIYAASEGQGIFRTTDGGSTWTFAAGGTDNLVVRAVNFAPGDSGTIMIGNSSTAIFKSTDAGASFEPSSVGIGALDVQDIAANPDDAKEMAIAFQGQNDGGIYATTDGGLNWELQSAPGTRWGDVLFADDGTLYATSTGPSSIAPEGVYRRNPDGTWTGLGPDQGTYFETELYCIAMDPIDDQVIWAGGNDFGVAGWAGTVWKSPDAGVTWDKVFIGSKDYESVRDLAFTPTAILGGFTCFGSPQIGGVFRSADGGTTWVNSSTGLDAECQIEALEVDGGRILAADDDYGNGGLFVSTDDGLTWSNTGFTGQVHTVLVDPRDSDNVFILQRANDRVLYSSDGGAVFETYNSGLDDAGWMSSMKFIDGPCPRMVATSTTGSWMTLVDGLAGDINGDGTVDLADLGILLASFEIDDGGDIDGDGDTDLADLGALLAEFGLSCD
jgi:photosystem II stability/assembly factor-like uncharacterized protein